MFNRASRRAQQSFKNDTKRGKKLNHSAGKKMGHPIKRGQQAWSI